LPAVINGPGALYISQLKLDPAKSKVIVGFVETYLKLTAEEMNQYERQFAELTLAEQEETIGLVSSWEQEGIEKGKEGLVVLQIKKRFGAIGADVRSRNDQPSTD
jgi:hypothetical protein